LEQRIERLQSLLQSKPQTVDAVKDWQTVTVLETSPKQSAPSSAVEVSNTEPQSPANGRPITVLQTEAPDLELAEGIEQ
jgi:hypothetical protein